jgi:hypothetical protein
MYTLGHIIQGKENICSFYFQKKEKNVATLQIFSTIQLSIHLSLNNDHRKILITIKYVLCSSSPSRMDVPMLN